MKKYNTNFAQVFQFFLNVKKEHTISKKKLISTIEQQQQQLHCDDFKTFQIKKKIYTSCFNYYIFIKKAAINTKLTLYIQQVASRKWTQFYFYEWIHQHATKKTHQNL